MTELALTRHAEVRLPQRGLRDADIALLLDAATPVAGDALLMTDADANREIAKRKREIQQIERLRGVKVVVADGAVVTVYHSRPSDQRRALRGGARRLRPRSRPRGRQAR
jgi:hypothetical protein